MSASWLSRVKTLPSARASCCMAYPRPHRQRCLLSPWSLWRSLQQLPAQCVVCGRRTGYLDGRGRLSQATLPQERSHHQHVDLRLPGLPRRFFRCVQLSQSEGDQELSAAKSGAGLLSAGTGAGQQPPVCRIERHRLSKRSQNRWNLHRMFPPCASL
jgi:hypothetical protein